MRWEVQIWSLAQSSETSARATSFKFIKRKCVWHGKKNKISFTASIDLNTLRSVLSVKLTKPNATKFKPDKTLLKSAESETWEYNKTLVFLIIHCHKKVKKGDVIIILLAVYFYLYIFCCNNDEGNDTKQIFLFFIIPGGWKYMSFLLTFLKFGYIIHILWSVPNLF